MTPAEASLRSLLPTIRRMARRTADSRPDLADDLAQEASLEVWLVLTADPAASRPYLLEVAARVISRTLDDEAAPLGAASFPSTTRRRVYRARALMAQGRSLREAARESGLAAGTLVAGLQALSTTLSDEVESEDAGGATRPAVPMFDGGAAVNPAAARAVRAVLEQLEPRQAETLRWAYGIDDGIKRSIAELAIVLGVSKATAARRHDAALRAARSHPLPDIPEPDEVWDLDETFRQAFEEVAAYTAAL
jgi:hypothetical protein